MPLKAVETMWCCVLVSQCMLYTIQGGLVGWAPALCSNNNNVKKKKDISNEIFYSAPFLSLMIVIIIFIDQQLQLLNI